jgi:nucleoside-diphosphate-sugar epimerase
LLRRNTPSYLIKLSGTGTLYDYPDTKEYLGRFNPKTYSYIDHIDEILSLPAHALHRYTDSIVQDAALKHPDKLKTAIVCPPDVYGPGHGAGRKLTYYLPCFVEDIQKPGAPSCLNDGSNMRGWVHIDDFMQIYVALVEAAAAGGGPVTWGEQVSSTFFFLDISVTDSSQGYFLAASQEHSPYIQSPKLTSPLARSVSRPERPLL